MMAQQRVTRSQSRASPLQEHSVEGVKDKRNLASKTEPWATSLPSRHARAQADTEDADIVQLPTPSTRIEHLPIQLVRKNTKLSAKEHKLVLIKQQKLRELDLANTSDKQDRFVNHTSSSRAKSSHLNTEDEDRVVKRVCAATLIFASEFAGTAVCIDESGLLLTCAHCVAESEEESRSLMAKDGKHLWLLTSSGAVVRAKCIAWDELRDLALLEVVGAQFEAEKDIRFDCIIPASGICKRQARICCVGHPGSEDLEAEQSGVATDYPVLAISEGRFLGYAVGQDVQDNSEIGALKHNAWTYWGHSGAPLVDLSDGKLIGLHSSWDDATGTRRGVGIEAINSFVEVARQNRIPS